MKLTINDNYEFNIRKNQERITLDHEELQVTCVSLPDGHFQMIYQNRSYNLELVSDNHIEKTMVVKVNGREYEVRVKDQYDQLLKQMGLDSLKTSKVKELKAPMPGLVLNVLVEEGQEVKKGEGLLILEAMKMENIIKAASDGLVSKILIQRGSKFEKNEILIHF